MLGKLVEDALALLGRRVWHGHHCLRAMAGMGEDPRVAKGEGEALGVEIATMNQRIRDGCGWTLMLGQMLVAAF